MGLTLFSLSRNCSTLPLYQESNHNHMGPNEHDWAPTKLCQNKTKTDSRPDLDHSPMFSGLLLKMTCLGVGLAGPPHRMTAQQPRVAQGAGCRVTGRVHILLCGVQPNCPPKGFCTFASPPAALPCLVTHILTSASYLL